MIASHFAFDPRTRGFGGQKLNGVAPSFLEKELYKNKNSTPFAFVFCLSSASPRQTLSTMPSSLKIMTRWSWSGKSPLTASVNTISFRSPARYVRQLLRFPKVTPLRIDLASILSIPFPPARRSHISQPTTHDIVYIIHCPNDFFTFPLGLGRDRVHTQ